MSGATRVKPIGRRRRVDRLFAVVCMIATSACCLVLGLLIVSIVAKGMKFFDVSFFTNFATRRPAEAGIRAALAGSLLICSVCAMVAVPIGVGTAILLEEYAPRRGLARRVHGIIQLNVSNLAGVPSVVYGLIGLTVFVRMFGLFGSTNTSVYDRLERVSIVGQAGAVLGFIAEESDTHLVLDEPKSGPMSIAKDTIRRRAPVFAREFDMELSSGERVIGRLKERSYPSLVLLTGPDEESVERRIDAAEIRAWTTRNAPVWGDPNSFWYFQLPFGNSVLAGGMTLALVVLPIVIISTRESIRAVPDSLRQGAYALGATRWQMIARTVLPAAMPGIMTGVILAISRAVGEAAPIILVGGVVFTLASPNNLFDRFTVMPVQIYNWAGMPQEEFHRVAATGIIVLLGLLLVMNGAAILIRQRFQKALQ